MKVAVVEDQAIIAADLESTIQQAGHEVTVTAGTGEDALVALEDAMQDERAPDVVFMDIHLGTGMDGIACAQDVRHRWPSVKIVFLTAYTDKATVRRASAVSPDGYLSKPFDFDLLTALFAHLS